VANTAPVAKLALIMAAMGRTFISLLLLVGCTQFSQPASMIQNESDKGAKTRDRATIFQPF
jgi:hypothetical protein